METEVMLLANSLFLLIVLIILIAVSSSNEKPRKRRFKVKDDLKRIKEQISN